MNGAEDTYIITYGQQETQQDKFLSTNPEYDGRQVIIAIFDSGVDPAFPGLQTTTTGESKIIDCIDCTGCGDVDMTIIKSASNGTIEGLTGRTLKIPTSWKNPTSKYHLGIKAIYELYTNEMKKDVQLKRRTEFLTNHQQNMKEINEVNTKHLSISDEKDMMDNQNRIREDILSKKVFLEHMLTAEDLGPVADCIAWHDGYHWRASIDTTFCGCLENCRVLGSFKETGEYAKVSPHDDLTYCFGISQDGNWLQIVVADTVHGNFSSAVAAAYHPSKPELNGLAPGAKILSLKIYDTRTSTLSDAAFMKALALCAEYKVDIISISTGDGESRNYSSFHLKELTNFIRQRNILCFSSGGNGGPALFTSELPAAGGEGLVIGIGAFCPAEFRTISENGLLNFSSRGPCLDGHLGISLIAPGCATLCSGGKTDFSMGTSLSAPFGAGMADIAVREQFVRRLYINNQIDWVDVGHKSSITSDGFEVLLSIDYTHFHPGELYFTEVFIIDEEIPSLGPILRLPISILPPQGISDGFQEKFVISSGVVVRKFIVTPHYAKVLEVNLTKTLPGAVMPMVEVQISSTSGEFPVPCKYGGQVRNPAGRYVTELKVTVR